MNHWMVGGLLAALLGLLISCLSYQLSLWAVRKNPNMLSMMSIPRQIIHVAFLLAAWFLGPYTPWDPMALVVGAAIGLTAAMYYFTRKLLAASRAPAEKETASGGDDNG